MTTAEGLIENLIKQEGALEFVNFIDYRVARSQQELEKAYNLVYEEYLKRGYTKENASKLRLSIYNTLPQATTFIAASGDTVIATATVVPDSPLGLPMDEIYRQELNKLRKQNKKICEISMLASNTELFEQGISMMLNAKKLLFIFSLFKVIFDYAAQILRLDYICISINPKHKLTYDFLLFKDLGELKTYNHANGAPAVAKCLNLKTAPEECKRKESEGLYQMFMAKNTPPEKFSQKISFSAEDLKYFFADKSDVLENASKAQLNYLKKCYPACNFSKIIN